MVTAISTYISSRPLGANFPLGINLIGAQGAETSVLPVTLIGASTSYKLIFKGSDTEVFDIEDSGEKVLPEGQLFK